MFKNRGTGSRLLLLLTIVATAGWLAGGCDTTRFTMRQPPGQQVDVFRQATVPNVNVLWVVDNSDSMVEEQQALADSFQDFYKYMEQLVDVDSEEEVFQIGVISTDVYNSDHRGRLLGEVPIITNNTPDAEAVFRENVNVGIGGTGNEQGFHAAYLALTEPLISGANSNFLQENAHLFIIFVSDEDDGSFGEVKYYLKVFEQLKGKGNDGMIKVAAVVGDVPEVPEQCRVEKNVDPGERYAELAEKSGGIVLSICDDNFAANLDELGFSAAGLKRYFALSRRAKPGTIQVWVKTMCSSEAMPESVCARRMDDCHGRDDDLYGYTCVLRQSLPDGWSYEETTNSIRIFGEALPPFGSVVEVGYTPEEDSY
jgi:hypothetical protein